MRYGQFADQPSSQSRRISKLVAANLVARDRLLRIIEIIKLLGFADTHGEFARRFLSVNLQYFLRGLNKHLDPWVLDHLQAKIDIGSNTTAHEIQIARSRNERLIASTRNDLMQLVQVHYNEVRQKLA